MHPLPPPQMTSLTITHDLTVTDERKVNEILLELFVTYKQTDMTVSQILVK